MKIPTLKRRSTLDRLLGGGKLRTLAWVGLAVLAVFEIPSMVRYLNVERM